MLNWTLLCQTSPINVFPGQAGVSSAFLLTNAGNGPDTAQLTVDNNLVGSDDYDPSFVAIWLDDGDGIFQGAGTDMPYVPGSNDPQLASGESIVVFVQNDIPTGLSDADEGESELTAVSILQSDPLDPVGTAYIGQGVDGVNAIVGQTQATASDVCVHRSLAILVTLQKTSEILPEFNTDTVLPGEVMTDPIPGAVITYTLTATATGMGTAEEVIISDPIPGGLVYAPGNLKLDATVLTEAVDGDAGEFNAGQIMVRLPDMADGESYTVTFNATIE